MIRFTVVDSTWHPPAVCGGQLSRDTCPYMERYKTLMISVQMLHQKRKLFFAFYGIIPVVNRYISSFLHVRNILSPFVGNRFQFYPNLALKIWLGKGWYSLLGYRWVVRKMMFYQGSIVYMATFQYQYDIHIKQSKQIR